jgi:hypothetical protein
VESFATIGWRGGVRFGRHELILDAENVTDEITAARAGASMRQDAVCSCDISRASEWCAAAIALDADSAHKPDYPPHHSPNEAHHDG